jgi:hypothetical protein
MKKFLSFLPLSLPPFLSPYPPPHSPHPFFGMALFCSSSCPGTYYVVQSGLGLTTILPPWPPECYGYRYSHHSQVLFKFIFYDTKCKMYHLNYAIQRCKVSLYIQFQNTESLRTTKEQSIISLPLTLVNLRCTSAPMFEYFSTSYESEA